MNVRLAVYDIKGEGELIQNSTHHHSNASPHCRNQNIELYTRLHAKFQNSRMHDKFEVNFISWSLLLFLLVTMPIC